MGDSDAEPVPGARRATKGHCAAGSGAGGAHEIAGALQTYRLIVESMTEGVSLSTEDGIIVYTNPAEDRMFGYSEGELIGCHVSTQNAGPGEANDDRVAEVIGTLRREGVWVGEWHNRRRDGSTFYTASRITAVMLDGRTHWLCVQRDITKERAERAAHAGTKERLQLAVEGTGAGIYDMNLETGIGYWSESVFRILGFVPTPDGRATVPMWRERIHPDDADSVLTEHKRAIGGSGDFRQEFRIVRADDGKTRWISVVGRMVPDAVGLRSIGTIVDTTERKRVEAAQRDSEARLRVAMEAGKLGSWWFDIESGTGGWSEYSARMLGVSAKNRAVTFGEWRGLVYPGDRVAAEAAFAAAIAGETPIYDAEYRVVHPNGAVRRLHAVGAVERGADGCATYVVGTFRDVTDERNASEALAESAGRLDLAVTAHGIGIFDWYVQTGKVVWTEQEETLFGLRPGSFGGDIADWAKCLLPEDAEAMQAAMGEAMAERRPRLDFAFRIRRPDGAIRWIEGSGRFLYGDDGTPLRMVGTNMDVTERRRAEDHQRLLVNELNHRVKNTLAIVQGIAHQSFRGPAVPAEIRSAFDGRLAALSAAHNLLTRESWEAASIAQVVADAVAPLQSGRVETSGPDLRLPAKTAVALALALHELCTNAAKYGALSSPDGTVAVEWVVAGEMLRFSWRESGGPRVVTPTRRGFGTRMIERALAAEFGGTATIAFPPEGVICTLEARLPA
ncbi:PAS domain-containing sensor histidine kinase [Allosphingosinicella deserti]|uniref:PAS domain-containing sensor histidine kinase n=1 Tax=Allosphingosinicella deserti TaxID=2116704 RepID=UPI0013049E8B|nr:PAS domain-containing protein [Sphingomonas deserti]